MYFQLYLIILGEKSKGCFRDLLGIYRLLTHTINFDTKIPYNEKQISDAIKTFLKYMKINKKRFMDRKYVFEREVLFAIKNQIIKYKFLFQKQIDKCIFKLTCIILPVLCSIRNILIFSMFSI